MAHGRLRSDKLAIAAGGRYDINQKDDLCMSILGKKPDDDIGPLPQVDRNAILQTLSISKFNDFLPKDRFYFRSELGSDYGVDGELELFNNGSAMNFRSKVQLKATDSDKLNNDGSVSITVASSSLNYLLNGNCPLYILYVAPRNELRFIWARQEMLRIETANPDWRQQKTVTLHFDQIVDTNTVDDIYVRICDEGKSFRKTFDILARSSSLLNIGSDGAQPLVSVSFDVTTLAVTDPAEVKTFLIQNGMAMVASGLGGKVIELFDQITASAARTPHLQLIRAHAYISLGHYMDSQAAVAESLRLAARGSELKDEERSFLFYIQRMCDYQLGRLTLNEYIASMQTWELKAEQEGDFFVISYKLTKFRDGYLGEDDPREKAEQLQHLRDLVARVCTLPNASQTIKLDARLALLYADGAEIASEFFMVAASVELAHQMGRPANAKQGLLLATRLLAWEQQAEEISQEARTLVHPLLYADTLTIRLTVRISQLTTLTFGVSSENDRPSFNVLYPLMVEAQEAISIFKRAGNLEGELHAKLRLADLFELNDQVEAATKIARGILPLALAMGYRNVEDRAIEHIERTTVIARRATDKEEQKNTDTDVTRAAMTDEDLRSFSLLFMKTCNLPDERFEFVERDLSRGQKL